MADNEESNQGISFEAPEGDLGAKLANLQQSAYSSFQLIEPWNTASSDIQVVAAIITDVKGSGSLYYSALDCSITSSQVGYTLSDDCENLCVELRSGAPAGEVASYVSELRSKAQAAHSDATQTLEMFRSVRQGLVKATGNVADVVEHLRSEGTALQTVVFLTLPDELLIEHRPRVPTDGPPPPNARVAKPRNNEEAGSQLIKATTILVNLIDHVGVFARWWSDLDTKLWNVEDKAKKMDPNRVLRLAMSSAITNWREIKGLYLSYKDKMSTLQDFFPVSRQKTNPNSVDVTPDVNLELPKPDLDSLVNTTYTSFQLMEPWSRARSKHSAVTALIDKIRELVLKYYGTLSTAIQVVMEGYSFGSDMDDLCTFLSEPEHSHDTLLEYTMDLRENVKQQLATSKKIIDDVRSIGTSLSPFPTNLPQERGLLWVGQTSQYAFLPAQIPITTIESNFHNRANPLPGRQEDSKTKDQIRELLHQTIEKLNQFSQDMEPLANWWLALDHMLGLVEVRIEHLRSDQQQVGSAKEHWSKVKEYYFNTHRNVEKLKRYYQLDKV